jgi:hypothetical protein
MVRRISTWCVLLPLLAATVHAQGLDTRATKDDWEEINFEFNSSILVDGFPSLLRIAELLQKNAGYKVTVEGHTDKLGGNGYNDRLGLARANTVRDFLVKYGARGGQIEVRTRGKMDPKYPGGKDAYSRTDEARWMNRRVAITVVDDQGRSVGAGSAGDAIRALQPQAAANPDCCSEVLKRLDKLDAIEQMLKDLADQNKKLADELAGLRQNQQNLENRVGQANQAATQAAAQAAAIPKPPTTDEVAKAVTDAIDKKTPPKFQMLGLNIGANQDGDVTFTGKGRYFSPFGDRYAFQSEGEYFYNKGQREGQFDFGLVDRIGRFQAGLFSSFKHVNLTGDQTGGTLGEGALTMEYMFKWGKVGVFGTKAFLDDAIVNRANVISPTGVFMQDFVNERYLRVVDQAGVSGTGPLFGKNYFEGNLGYLRSTTAGDRVGGTLRLIFPVTNKIAFTVEGGMNETLLGPGNNGRAVVGVEFGNRIRPSDYLTSAHATPMQIPRVRYEVLTRTVRTGNLPPVANAGPNQTLPGAQTVTLNGSASYDPDGDPITFQWSQELGPAIALSAPTKAITTFSAAAGQTYSFLLTVTDSLGAKGIARVRITAGGGTATIVSFVANPTTINSGQSSTLSWQVTNADSVSITSLGSVALTGSQAVSPTVTTTYILTATKGSTSTTAAATVTVNGTTTGLPVIASFTANPTSITAGQSSTLTWATQNATSVSISSLGGVVLAGNQTVSPATTTTYTLTATNATGSVTAQATVTVTGSNGVLITNFTATPSSIPSGGSSVLACTATGATSVAINGAVTQGTSATTTVTPAQTTTYTCIATGPNNQTDTRQVTVTVSGTPPVIVIAGGPNQYTNRRHLVFDATASSSPSGNTPLRYHWSSNNFGAVALTSADTATPDVVLPPILGTYTFTLTVTDSKGNIATSMVSITLTATNIF